MTNHREVLGSSTANVDADLTQRLTRVFLYSIALACAFGCGRAPTPGVAPPSPAAAVEDDGREGATLEVDNSSIFDVRIFVLRGSERTRLGIVTSGATVQFPLPAPMLGRELVFYAEPVGASARQRTDGVYVRPGQHVKLGLEKRLRSYSIAVH